MPRAQNEGGITKADGVSPIWDAYARKKGTIKGGAKPYIACDFYHRYKEDLLLTKALGFNSFRFSISWSRVLPDGSGRPNKEGLRYYHDVIDECLRLGLEPYVTLYHWDLPLALQKEWRLDKLQNDALVPAVRDALCAEEYGSKVKNWIVLNEPAAFTTLGYMLGRHAPGLTGLDNFFAAVHNVVLAQSHGGRITEGSGPRRTHRHHLLLFRGNPLYGPDRRRAGSGEGGRAAQPAVCGTRAGERVSIRIL